MPFLANSLTALGVLLLAHACYSAHEHSSLLSLHPATSPSPSLTSTPLPLDITLETLISVLVICVGVVAGADALRPVSWRVWAAGFKGGVAGPYEGLEAREGFWDVRASRREFAEWVREGAVGVRG